MNRKTVRPSIACLTLVAVTLAILSACTAPADQAASEAPRDFDSLLEDPELVRQRYADVIEAVEQCMQEKGFDLESTNLPPMEWWRTLSEVSAVSRPDYLLNMTDSQATTIGFGYGLGIQADHEGRTFDPFPLPDLDGDLSIVSTEESEYVVALYGVSHSDESIDPTEGCISIAEDAVGSISPAIAEEQFVNDLERLIGDAHYLSLAGDWEACISASGFELGSDPITLGPIVNALARQIDEITGTEDAIDSDSDISAILQIEYAAAQAHVECIDPIRQDLKTIWNEYLSDYQEFSWQQKIRTDLDRRQRVPCLRPRRPLRRAPGDPVGGRSTPDVELAFLDCPPEIRRADGMC